MTKVSHTPARCTWINTGKFPSTIHRQCLQRHLPIVRRHIQKHKEQRNMWADSLVRKTRPWVLPVALLNIPAPKTQLPMVLYENATWHLPHLGILSPNKRWWLFKYENTTVSHPVLHLLLQKSNWQWPNNDLTSRPFASRVSLFSLSLSWADLTKWRRFHRKAVNVLRDNNLLLWSLCS